MLNKPLDEIEEQEEQQSNQNNNKMIEATMGDMYKQLQTLQKQVDIVQLNLKHKNAEISTLFKGVENIVLSDVQIIVAKISNITSHLSEVNTALEKIWEESEYIAHQQGYAEAYARFKLYSYKFNKTMMYLQSQFEGVKTAVERINYLVKTQVSKIADEQSGVDKLKDNELFF